MWVGLFPGSVEEQRADRPHHQRRPRPDVAGAADASGLRPPPGARLAARTRATRGFWEAIENVDDGELWETHQTLKTRLIDFARRRVVRQAERRGEAPEYVGQLKRALSARRADHRLRAPLCHLQARRPASCRTSTPSPRSSTTRRCRSSSSSPASRTRTTAPARRCCSRSRS